MVNDKLGSLNKLKQYEKKFYDEKNIDKSNKYFNDIKNIFKKHFIKNSDNALQDIDYLYLYMVKVINCYSFQDLQDFIYNEYHINLPKKDIISKLNKINIDSLKNIIDDLINYIYDTFKPKNIVNNKKITLIDGSDMCANISLKDYGYDTNDLKSYTTPYFSFLYDFNYEICLDINISKKYNEREALREQINLLPKETYVMTDAGYPKYSDMNKIDKMGLKYFTRVPYDWRSSKYLDSIGSKDEQIIVHGKKHRIFKYSIENNNMTDDNTFYIMTNDFDTPYEQIITYYHFRWKIETFIDYFKNIIGAKYYNVTTEKRMYRTMYIQRIIHLITNIFTRASEDMFGETYNSFNIIQNLIHSNKSNLLNQINKKDFNKINNKSSTKTTVMSIFNNMLYKNRNSKKIYNDLYKIHSTQSSSILDRSFSHYPTKKLIKNNIKNKLKQKSKRIVKEKYDIDIYLDIELNNNEKVNIQDNIKSLEDHFYNYNKSKNYFTISF